MLLAILVLFIGLTILFLILDNKVYSCDYYDALSGISGAMSIVVAIIYFVLILLAMDDWNVNKKIEMYQEENAIIEQQINDLVTNYMEYEQDTFKDFKSESSITLVSLYPELKSDELVQAQIDTYIENNNKIKELKEAAIDLSVLKWWLYFGH